MKIVITTIQEPNLAIKQWAKKSEVIVIGDAKTSKEWNCDNCDYYDLERQKELGFEITEALPENHYSRKNIGYLLAMKEDKIFDTDDDNYPHTNWRERELKTMVTHSCQQEWCNIYQPLTSGKIWQRGFPLTLIKKETELTEIKEEKICPIQQGLSDSSPDVDAIWRLIDNREVYFWVSKSIWLRNNSWSPFNSQVTWWFPEAYPLLYLPSTTTFRMTDIIRSFVAQKCLWQMGYGVVFHSPSEVVQERNPHNLLKDFEDEISGYLNNEIIAKELTQLELTTDVFYNMQLCYNKLIELNVVDKIEMAILLRWIKDVKGII